MRCWLFLWLALAVAPAGAQTIIISPAPESTSVTVYRDPDRGEGTVDARNPSGFALISEKRRIALPAGESVIRFEGVADGMIAVSAVVTGLPGGVIQKNRDARLLSPATLLLDRLGKRVHLRRTNRATGKVVDQDAIVRTTPGNALIVESAGGFEALRCSGLPETILYDAVPPDLSVTPTLSVSTNNPQATTVEVMLTYLATGFDWGASYVARIAPDGRALDLSAWLTVVNGNSIGFADARLLAVAGRLNRASNYAALVTSSVAPPLTISCWPEPTYASEDEASYDGAGVPPPPPSPAPVMMARMEDVVVSARRVAEQEDLGDLKLYRVPMTVDINPAAQKQVALLHQVAIPIATFYSARLSATGDARDEPLVRMIRFANTRQNGAGVPLPSGALSLFTQRDGEQLLLAQVTLGDHAVGEMVEIEAGASPQRRVTQETVGPAQRRLRLVNAGADAMHVELLLQDDPDQSLVAPPRSLSRRDGQWLWTITVPANGTAQLDYRIRVPKR